MCDINKETSRTTTKHKTGNAYYNDEVYWD